jgi:hypothetical protein
VNLDAPNARYWRNDQESNDSKPMAIGPPYDDERVRERVRLLHESWKQSRSTT